MAEMIILVVTCIATVISTVITALSYFEAKEKE